MNTGPARRQARRQAADARVFECIIAVPMTLTGPSMRKLLPLVLAALITTGCGVVYRQPIYQGNLLDKAAVDQLQVGMDQRQVMGLLGTPAIRDPFHQDRWDYVASRRIGRGGDTVVKNMTVWFENGNLARWEGEYFPEEDSELAKTMSRFGNLPKDDKKKRRR